MSSQIRKIQRAAWRASFAPGQFKRRARRGNVIKAFGKKFNSGGAWQDYRAGF